jgi:hypothetical protein
VSRISEISKTEDIII